MMHNNIYNENSSTSGSTSPVGMDSIEEPRKKGARGGKRSVAHLSKAQLARKRANDREAQRNIRQRTKEHIETLEKKVRELEEGRREVSVERIIKRNQELESEVERLRSQLNLQEIVQPLPTPSRELQEELLLQPKVEWMPEPSNIWSNHVSPIESPHDSPFAEQPYPPTSQPVYPVHHSIGGYVPEQSPEALFAPSDVLLWEEPIINSSNQTSPEEAKAIQAWAPLQEPSRFLHLEQTGFADVMTPPPQYLTTCWQAQPSTYAWQICTKLKAPGSLLDQLMFSIIHSQRHIAITSASTTADIPRSEAMGPSFPSVHVLFNQTSPAYKSSTSMEETMNRYANLLSKRGFLSIPERLASFMCMYRFIQWQICPSQITYSSLHEWQAPRPSQLMIPHPAWMDLPPWGRFRDKIINDQDRYDNMEFQNTYAQNLCVNWPFDPMKALVFENGAIRISEEMDKHVSDLGNISMKKEFIDKYPEFKDVCRFDEE